MEEFEAHQTNASHKAFKGAQTFSPNISKLQKQEIPINTFDRRPQNTKSYKKREIY